MNQLDNKFNFLPLPVSYRQEHFEIEYQHLAITFIASLPFFCSKRQIFT